LELEQAKVDSEVQAEAAKAREIADKAAKRKRDLLMLSFDADDDDWSAPVKLKKGKKEAAEARPVQLAKLTKDPSADTSFLPDRDRDAEAASARAALGSEWEAAQAAVKLEQIEVVYSYWDGAGHRRSTRVQKGHTIEEFLGAVLAELAPDFRELRSLDASALMYVKEDVILPPHLSFYELILQQARGKSGPLFSFGVQEDVRLLSDARIERDETHAGKVLTRAWYERNKHVFPASRWEPYDPKKTYGKYTVG
jgi:protein FAM50